MNGRIRRSIGAVVPAMIIGAVLGAAVASPSAATVAQPVGMSIQAMLPGEARTTIQDFTVPVRARVAATDWNTAGAAAEWDVALCTTDGCTPWSDLVGTTLASGTHELRATVRMPADVAQGASASASGTVTFVEAHATLPSTGATLAAGLLGAGIAALIGGLIIVIIARRRNDEEDEVPAS